MITHSNTMIPPERSRCISVALLCLGILSITQRLYEYSKETLENLMEVVSSNTLNTHESNSTATNTSIEWNEANFISWETAKHEHCLTSKESRRMDNEY